MGEPDKTFGVKGLFYRALGMPFVHLRGRGDLRGTHELQHWGSLPHLRL